MSAKEMFEELGYENSYYKEDVLYITKDENGIDIEIYFDIENKELILSSNRFTDFLFNTQELKAINKQVEELGWNE